jgi:hypothetical protein
MLKRSPQDSEETRTPQASEQDIISAERGGINE